MIKAKKEEKAGKVSIRDLQVLVNKKAGFNVAYLPSENEDPALIKDWISTGSTWLDYIIAKGQVGGVPAGRVTEVAGLESSGKTYMALQIAKNAQKKGYRIVFFDSESTTDHNFMKSIGLDLENILYIQAKSIEFVMETIETLMSNSEEKMLFIWDSYANTPSESELEQEKMNPTSGVAVAARVNALALKKLTIPLSNHQSALLILNQLKHKIGRTPAETNAIKFDPYETPGGKSFHYAFSLRIWLTGKKTQAGVVLDERGYRIGNEVVVKLRKSKFGTEARQCAFKIITGADPLGIMDEESWLEAIEGSDKLVNGTWKELTLLDGTKEKFQNGSWLEKLKNPKFRETILAIMKDEMIKKFSEKTGDPKNYYNKYDSEEVEEVDSPE